MARRTRPRGARRWRRLALRGVAAAGALAIVATAAPLAVLARVPPPTSAFMLRAHRADPATGRACRAVAYRWVPRERIAPDLRRAVVLAEDQRFLLHWGFDLRSIRRALEERFEEGRVRGASTLTQQVAKNLFLWPGRSWLRKGLEAWLTAWIEILWSKQRILEVYLNVAQFGPCLFGAEAAARHFFGVDAARLSPEQAARLAAVLPEPGRLRADDPGPYLRERTDEILALLEDRRTAPYVRGL